MATEEHQDKRQSKPSAVGALCRERMFRTLLLAAGLIIAACVGRSHYLNTLDPAVFYEMKTLWQGCSDIVVAGDSRVYNSLSPAAMSADLPGRRIHNFAFPAVGFSETYLNAVNDALDPHAQSPVILVGVTPNSLTRGASDSNGFQHIIDKTPSVFLRQINYHFRAVALRSTIEGIRNPGDKTYTSSSRSLAQDGTWIQLTRTYHPDGWIASTSDPETPKAAFNLYDDNYKDEKNGPVSSEVVGRLIEQVRAWRQRGIQVFGFRPPTNPQFAEMENEEANFDEKAFIASFNKAGGTWIEVDHASFHTIDGQHLHRDSAVELSQFLAKRIAEPDTVEGGVLK